MRLRRNPSRKRRDETRRAGQMDIEVCPVNGVIMKTVLTITSAVLLLLVFAIALLGWRASYRAPSFNDPAGGVTSQFSNSTVVTNRQGWVTITRHGYPIAPNQQLLSFPWWPFAIVPFIIMTSILVRLVRRKRSDQRQGFAVESVSGTGGE